MRNIVRLTALAAIALFAATSCGKTAVGDAETSDSTMTAESPRTKPAEEPQARTEPGIETIELFCENGEGGIHRQTGYLVEYEGQQYIDMTGVPLHAPSDTARFKVQRVADSVHLLWHRKNWNKKYTYGIEVPTSLLSYRPYYFNMESEWLPSLTDDSQRYQPLGNVTVYYEDDGIIKQSTLTLISDQGTYSLYFGDDFFYAKVEPNVPEHDTGTTVPAWAAGYRYRGYPRNLGTVYFNYPEPAEPVQTPAVP